MQKNTINKNGFQRNWKWMIPTILLIICIYLFFDISQNAPLRYGTVIAEPKLIENARVIANKNVEVREKFGILQSHQFLNLLNGEVVTSEDYQKIGISVKLKGDKQPGILDIWARKVGENWVYDSIFVRIKKPKKMRISIIK